MVSGVPKALPEPQPVITIFTHSNSSAKSIILVVEGAERLVSMPLRSTKSTNCLISDDHKKISWISPVGQNDYLQTPKVR